MNLENSKIGQRLKMARERAGIAQTTFARSLGVTSGYISQIEQGKSPGREIVMKASGLLGVDLEWLLTGRGEMQPKEHRDQDAIDVMELVERLPPDRRAKVKEYVFEQLQLSKFSA